MVMRNAFGFFEKKIITKSSNFEFFVISPEVNDIFGITQYPFTDPLIAQPFAYLTECVTHSVTEIPMLSMLNLGTFYI